ncbi:selenium metabolism protein YedF [Acetoanaerobium pronyense]|uniref:Selenium metabolism protein YedF n=1 Tax=Acetoanaerobium pronyense TaxID=1482736 RepID=A0ABS4KPK9_9FIRM|nr:sulfurtransferase-like selenium metabolism protein YedF [Acetoanaerobium pronyense]MBP2028549.1 selenium metabolism protein YedF [Acetoanaerobium pronyense]
MEIKKLDCTKLQCPQPVIMTKKELESMGEGVVEVKVDNTTAKENLLKLAASKGLAVDIEQNGSDYKVKIIKGEGEIPKEEKTIKKPSKISSGEEVVLITSEFLGKGNDDLGKILMKGFIYTLSETMPYPSKIMLINSAAKLSSENIETAENLKKLEENGVKIMTCGTCLDFYNLKENLKTGTVANMYDIVEALKETENKIIV